MTALSDKPISGVTTLLSGNQPPKESAPAMVPPSGESPREQLRRLVEVHQAGVWRYLRYLGADAAEADDLTQETFLSVGRSGLGCLSLEGDANHRPVNNSPVNHTPGNHTFDERDEKQTAGYLRTAARNQLLMLRRRQKRQIKTTDLAAAEHVWAHVAPDNAWQAFRDALSDCVALLQGRAQEAINLKYGAGESRTAIAKKLAMTPDGVKTLLRRTRKALRACIQRKLNALDP